MRIAIALLVLTAVSAAAVGGHQRAEREKAKAEIAKSCISGDGHYHETIFRHRPVCK